jgi:hypothetical protein
LHDGSFGRKSQRSKLRTTPVGQQQQSQEKRTFRCASKQDKVSQQSKEVNRSQYARACRGSEVVSEEGSWTTAARVIAQAESVDLPGSASIMPPSFTALNNDACLQHIKQMYDFLQMASWQTCVVCWRAWYAVDFNFAFARAAGKQGESHQWYKPGESVILGARRKRILIAGILILLRTRDQPDAWAHRSSWNAIIQKGFERNCGSGSLANLGAEKI